MRGISSGSQRDEQDECRVVGISSASSYGFVSSTLSGSKLFVNIYIDSIMQIFVLWKS